VTELTVSKIGNRIENKIQLDGCGVWTLANREKFSYSDGRSSELYLRRCFLDAKDLSSNSYELERWIKDWPSEYHLSRKRAQLLRGFDFEKPKRVLEVGCGCGAITRFLGETFDDVLAIEGSMARAQLARLRTKGMDNVSILCAPFQQIKFKERFDIIFCIGVFEYSNVFINAADPYDFILQYFSDILSDDGALIIAIENQFGLKYFSGCREDHVSIMFDGLEGYPRYSNKAKTFGYNEIGYRISKYFKKADFYFPYPDYKVPSCVLSDRLFSKVHAGELVGNFRSRDYAHERKSLFDEKFVLLELDKNGQLPFFSNSFLVTASKTDSASARFNQLGIMFSSGRVERLQTVTKFLENEDSGEVLVEKAPLDYQKAPRSSFLLHECKSKWVDGYSLSCQLMKRAKDRNISYEDLFAPCQLWLQKLNDLKFLKGDTFFLDGKHVDCLWRNAYINDNQCVFVDCEWEWLEPIKLNVAVLRAIYTFLYEISSIQDLSPILSVSSRKWLIKRIARTLNIKFDKNDFKEFINLEAKIWHEAFGSSITKNQFVVMFILWNDKLFRSFRDVRNTFKKMVSRSSSVLS